MKNLSTHLICRKLGLADGKFDEFQRYSYLPETANLPKLCGARCLTEPIGDRSLSFGYLGQKRNRLAKLIVNEI